MPVEEQHMEARRRNDFAIPTVRNDNPALWVFVLPDVSRHNTVADERDRAVPRGRLSRNGSHYSIIERGAGFQLSHRGATGTRHSLGMRSPDCAIRARREDADDSWEDIRLASIVLPEQHCERASFELKLLNRPVTVEDETEQSHIPDPTGGGASDRRVIVPTSRVQAEISLVTQRAWARAGQVLGPRPGSGGLRPRHDSPPTFPDMINRERSSNCAALAPVLSTMITAAIRGRVPAQDPTAAVACRPHRQRGRCQKSSVRQDVLARRLAPLL